MEKTHPVLRFLEKFWAPVPWMPEARVVLELILRKDARPSSAVSIHWDAGDEEPVAAFFSDL